MASKKKTKKDTTKQMNEKSKHTLNLGWLRAIGYFVIAPLLVALITPIIHYFQGNRSAADYAAEYIANSDTLTITVPNNLDEDGKTYKSHRWRRSENFYYNYVKRGRGNRDRKNLWAIIFYCKEYEKYIEVICFEGVERLYISKTKSRDIGNLRSLWVDHDGTVLCVYANRTQWNDSAYGTKENPMPVFVRNFVADLINKQDEIIKCDSIMENGEKQTVKKIIKVEKKTNRIPDDVVYQIRNVSAETNKLYVETYLRYILPKKEFKRLYGNDLK